MGVNENVGKWHFSHEINYRVTIWNHNIICF